MDIILKYLLIYQKIKNKKWKKIKYFMNCKKF